MVYLSGMQTWNKIKPVSPIPVIYNHTTVKLSDSLFVYGGQNQSGLTKQLLEYKISKYSLIIIYG